MRSSIHALSLNCELVKELERSSIVSRGTLSLSQLFHSPSIVKLQSVHFLTVFCSSLQFSHTPLLIPTRSHPIGRHYGHEIEQRSVCLSVCLSGCLSPTLSVLIFTAFNCKALGAWPVAARVSLLPPYQLGLLIRRLLMANREQRQKHPASSSSLT